MLGRFQFGYSIRFAGPSQCGKTHTLVKLLQSKDYFYPCPPRRIMWVTGSGARNEMLENIILELYPDSEFFYKMPSNEEIDEKIQKYDFWVFDDLASELKSNNSFTNFFTKTTHHKMCMMAYLTQNAYEQGSDSTTRTRNSHYQIFYNNKMDVRWIRVLGDQLLGNSKQFRSMFCYATPKPFDCLLIDGRPTTNKSEQFIGNPFNSTEEDPSYFLVPDK